MLQLVSLDIGFEVAKRNPVVDVELTSELALSDATFPALVAIPLAGQARLDLPVAAAPIRARRPLHAAPIDTFGPGHAASCGAEAQRDVPGSVPGRGDKTASALTAGNLSLGRNLLRIAYTQFELMIFGASGFHRCRETSNPGAAAGGTTTAGGVKPRILRGQVCGEQAAQ